MKIYHTRPLPFNFLNGTRMEIVMNKRDGVGMGATYPVVIHTFYLFLSFLFLWPIHFFLRHHGMFNFAITMP